MNTLPPTYVKGFHDLEAVKATEYKRLGNTDLLISKLSFGTGPLGCHYGNFDENEAIETIRQAIKQGINYIDTAPWYGQTKAERLLGKALEGIPREAYYIATKVGRYELDYPNMFDFSIEKTRQSFERSLKLLGLEYIDIIQVHDIEFAPSLDIIVTQTLPELSRQVAQGKAKYIGITGYPLSILKECIEKSNIIISSVLTYSRFTLIDDSLTQYIPFFKANNIGIINASPLALGLLTDNELSLWHPASNEIKTKCKEIGNYCKDKGMNLSKLALWYSAQCEGVATILTGIQNLKQLNMNLNVIRNGITAEEKILLQEIQEKYFSQIKFKHWEGVEVKTYWQAIKK